MSFGGGGVGGESAREIINDARNLGVTVDFAVSEEKIPAASVFKTRFRISLADAIALALAATHRAPVVTSDRGEFLPVEEDRAARYIWIR